MEELLVSLACLSSKGCSHTWEEYRRRNPAIEQSLKNAERLATTHTPKIVVDTVGPFMIFVSGREASFNMGSILRVKLSKESAVIAIEVPI
jgi:hypothetical protein